NKQVREARRRANRRAPMSVAAVVLWFAAVTGGSALSITNVSPVNVTPAGFSIVFQTSESAAPGISVYADAAGATNLGGQVGIERYPLHTGNPKLTDPYARRQNLAAIRQKTQNQNLAQVRVSGCQPGGTYYYPRQAN